MTTPQSEIDELNGILYGENIEFLRSTLVFSVADCIVKYRDPDLLKRFPGWVHEGVREMCELHQRDGRYGVVSNLGTVDHSAMVEQLVALLDTSVRPGSGL